MKGCQDHFSTRIASIHDNGVRWSLLGKYHTIFLREAFAAIAWCGGMRYDELQDLSIQDLHECPENIKVNFTHAKPWAEAKENTILVPLNKSFHSICLASKEKNISGSTWSFSR